MKGWNDEKGKEKWKKRGKEGREECSGKIKGKKGEMEGDKLRRMEKENME